VKKFESIKHDYITPKYGYDVGKNLIVEKAKFAVLHEIETKFPMNLFGYEWELMGKGENKKEYATFTKVELHIPAMFGFVYLALLLVFIFQFCGASKLV
jgi:hypothetical protein